jgi:hypothetical protein
MTRSVYRKLIVPVFYQCSQFSIRCKALRLHPWTNSNMNMTRNDLGRLQTRRCSKNSSSVSRRPEKSTVVNQLTQHRKESRGGEDGGDIWTTVEIRVMTKNSNLSSSRRAGSTGCSRASHSRTRSLSPFVESGYSFLLRADGFEHFWLLPLQHPNGLLHLLQQCLGTLCVSTSSESLSSGPCRKGSKEVLLCIYFLHRALGGNVHGFDS